ncbi:MAG: hypothetical protein ACJAYA_000063 [Bacteroidia bacterium]|jgi:hypothetical protein
MKKLLLFLFVPLIFAGCKKCVECEIRLKQSQDVIGFIDEFCGNDKKVEEEEERLRADYNCIECSVQTGIGTANSGIHCGDRAFTDSLENDWDNGAAEIGTGANCIYYRDTTNVICVLKN